MRAHPGRAGWLASVLTLTPACYALLWLALPAITRYWRGVLGWGAADIDPGLRVRIVDDALAWPALPLMSIELDAHGPSALPLAFVTVLSAAGFVTSFVDRARWLPLAYLLRAASAAQFAICVYFWCAGTAFPYPAPLHLRDIYVMQCSAIAIAPLLMAALYYPLDFTLAQKALASLLVTGYLAAALPFVMLLHAMVIHHGTQLLQPFCYFVLGAPLMVGQLVVLYAYCASWPGTLTLDGGPS